jgi:hypothetical protein
MFKKLLPILSFLFFACALQAQTFSGCLAHHPQYISGQFEVSYSSNCTGHDEPEITPLSSAAGSARDLTWTVVLPSWAHVLVRRRRY